MNNNRKERGEMKRKMAITAGTILLLIAALPLRSAAQPRVDFRMEFGDGTPVNRLYVDLGNYYHISYEELIAMHEAGICDDDIPVILYLHSRSPYSLRQLYGFRARGASWEQLSAWCRVPLRTYERERFSWWTGHPFANGYGIERRDDRGNRDGGCYSANDGGRYDRREWRNGGHDRRDHDGRSRGWRDDGRR
jgi:hypothetical protein